MRRKERELFIDMKLMVEAALGLWGEQKARLPAEVLWKHLARALIARIDNHGILPRDDAAPSYPPSLEPNGKAGRARDAAGDHIGKYVADYSEVTPEEIAERDAEYEKLVKHSRRA